ncbi:discoidin domain-containing protein [Sunxiuqinia elliptica]|uniref:Por secretion system C-terminal sorting domain-containing protein n=1 Tax=Sunxiuqinia elliptica TaxID=655355 RepID=A0A1I2G4D0_9BACT|nr:discoidin domain-containing protein [Sunxiuqinia elliptica]SFF11840.1 Por secretion system C-terminal sorting domain-containing protein [Sunxiuqinia elliptica]
MFKQAKIRYLKLILIIESILLVNISTFAQTAYTPYDELPGITKSYKPAYDDSYPEWAKMLYRYPINYYELNRAYNDYKRLNGKEKSPIIRFYKIWRQVVEPYVENDGTITLPDIGKLRENLYLLQTQKPTHLKSAPKSNADWTFLGPKETWWKSANSSQRVPVPWQANVYSFDVTPANPDILYCGTETGYVNKTTDKGLTWELVGKDYVFGNGIKAIAIHPENTDTVYVSAAKQIHITNDGGQSWMPALSSQNLFSANRLKIDYNNPSKIVAAADEGVYVSTDKGLSWSKKSSAIVYDIEIKPDDSNVIYAITIDGSSYALIYSSDGGNSFKQMNSFPKVDIKAGAMLAVTPDNPNALYAVMLSTDRIPYLYKGLHDGSKYTWTLLATGKTTAFGMDNGQGYFDLVLEVSPNDEDVIFAGTTTLFKSTNGGVTFEKTGGYSGTFRIHPDIQDMKILPNDETWIATDGGMNFSNDVFTSPSSHSARLQGIIGSQFWGFDQGWNEDIIVGGRYHNGNTAMSEGYGDKALRMGGAESATGWVLKGKSRHVVFKDLGNGFILPKTADEIEEGRFLFTKHPNMDEYGQKRSNVIIHPNYYDVIYLGEGTGLWRSPDGGINFDLLHDFGEKVRYLQISHKNPDVLYVDIVNQGLYQSTDGGVTWEHKPALTSGMYGNNYWKGKLFFVISPYDENVIYACQQNGGRVAEGGKVFKSTDGGDTWIDWSGNIRGKATKTLAIQPTKSGEDLVYLFVTSSAGKTTPAEVYYRKESDVVWIDFSKGFPLAFTVNLGIPFFRDAKMRVGGNGGVWESPLQEPEFDPVISPVCQTPIIRNMNDTVYFNDYSILNHSGATWLWEFNPAPLYINDANSHNPKAVFDKGVYDVTMNVTQNGKTFTKTVESMLTVKEAPSIYDCTNPGIVPTEKISLMYVDSEETKASRSLVATNAIDGDISTIWHTEWVSSNPVHPHEIQLDLGDQYNLKKIEYYPRQDLQNGRIKDYELYVTSDKNNWGSAISKGTFPNSNAPQTIKIEGLTGRYVKLVANSAADGNPHTSVAELVFTGCLPSTTGVEVQKYSNDIKAYPIPTSGKINLSVLSGNSFKSLEYQVYSIDGQVVKNGTVSGYSEQLSIDLSQQESGLYLLHLEDEAGTVYRLKVVKQ